MKSDEQIQKDVMEELRWQPFLKASEIGVAVKNGIVTLSGHVDSYSKKILAESATKKISGVKAIAEDIQIGVSPAYKRTDTEIAEAVLNTLKWHAMVPEGQIKVKVEDGLVKLEGEVEWEYQRDQAKRAVQHLTGVRAISNLISVKPQISPSDIHQKIKSAFQRSAIVDSGKIQAQVMGNQVTLSGKVRSHAEKEDAENAAWAAPGVMSVVNVLEIQEPQYAF